MRKNVKKTRLKKTTQVVKLEAFLEDLFTLPKPASVGSPITVLLISSSISVPVEPAAVPVPVLEQESVLDLSSASRQR